MLGFSSHSVKWVWFVDRAVMKPDCEKMKRDNVINILSSTIQVDYLRQPYWFNLRSDFHMIHKVGDGLLRAWKTIKKNILKIKEWGHCQLIQIQTCQIQKSILMCTLFWWEKRKKNYFYSIFFRCSVWIFRII